MPADEVIKRISLGKPGWFLRYVKSYHCGGPPYIYQIVGLDARKIPSVFVPVSLKEGVLERDVDAEGCVFRNDPIPSDLWNKAECLMKGGW